MENLNLLIMNHLIDWKGTITLIGRIYTPESNLYMNLIENLWLAYSPK